MKYAAAVVSFALPIYADLSFELSFDGAVREQLLTGRAYVALSRDDGRPPIMQAAAGRHRACPTDASCIQNMPHHMRAHARGSGVPGGFEKVQ